MCRDFAFALDMQKSVCLALIIAFTIFEFSLFAQAITSRNGDVSIPTDGRHAPSVFSNGGMIATGRAAEIVANNQVLRYYRTPRRQKPTKVSVEKASQLRELETLAVYRDGKIIAG